MKLCVFQFVVVVVVVVDGVWGWNGKQQHHHVLSTIDSIETVLSQHSSEERDAIREQSQEIKTELTRLSIVTSADDLTQSRVTGDKDLVTYQSAIAKLSSAFQKIQSLSDLTLGPLERRRRELAEECVEYSQETTKKLQQIHQSLTNAKTLQTEIRRIANNAMGKAEKIAFQALRLQAISLITTQNNNNTTNEDEDVDSGKFAEETANQIDSLIRILSDELIRESGRGRQKESECETKDGELDSQILESQALLHDSQGSLDRLIRVFAHAAKGEVGERTNQLVELAQHTESAREVTKSILTASVSSTEDISLSLCPLDCSAQGTCWSGVCHCDGGFVGDACGERQQ